MPYHNVIFYLWASFFQYVNYYDKQFLYKQKEHNHIHKKIKTKNEKISKKCIVTLLSALRNSILV